MSNGMSFGSIIFASLGSGYILDGEQASLQDSNDHFLANIQRDGTYSVFPGCRAARSPRRWSVA